MGADVVLHLGDCLDVMAGMEPNSVDAIVTDPPYGLAFMGKDWDHGVPGIPFWEMALRVAKPGAHLLAFGGTRTFHRLAVAIEDAGWEIRDTVMWVYGSGFPKSYDVSKAIDKAAGAEREVVRAKSYDLRNNGGYSGGLNTTKPRSESCELTAPATPAAQQWAGWGTALKPAWEPILVARKPLAGTVAANVLAWGTGAVNVDGCRVGTEKDVPWGGPSGKRSKYEGGWADQNGDFDGMLNGSGRNANVGRWPANVVHDGSDEVLAGFPVTTSRWGGENRTSVPGAVYGNGHGLPAHNGNYPAGTGSAARFFYCAKASRADRDEGLEGLPLRGKNEVYGDGLNTATKLDPALHTAESVAARPQRHNHHPTVKPTDLMRWLVRLVTPPGGVVLDPFMGSGSTGKAAVLEGMRFMGIEREAEYLEIARRRIDAARLPLFAGVEDAQ